MVGEILFSYSFAAVFPALVLYPYLYFMCVCLILSGIVWLSPQLSFPLPGTLLPRPLITIKF